MLEQRSRAHSVLTPGRKRQGHRLGSVGMLAAALAVGVTPVAVAIADSAPAGAAPVPYLSHFTTVTDVASTVPANGDQNPYAIVVAPIRLASSSARMTFFEFPVVEIPITTSPGCANAATWRAKTFS